MDGGGGRGGGGEGWLGWVVSHCGCVSVDLNRNSRSSSMWVGDHRSYSLNSGKVGEKAKPTSHFSLSSEALTVTMRYFTDKCGGLCD